MLVVLVLASGAEWESDALAVLERDRGLVVLRRCVDVPDLLAAASAGQADVAVVALEAPGLDLDAVDHLRRFRVRPVAVLPAGPAEEQLARAARLGLTATLSAEQLEQLPERVRADDLPRVATAESDPVGRVVAVWGPAGAPGRTTVAISVAAELAARRRRTTLVDVDPYGGTVAQQLGILDEVSGLLAAARLAGSGLLEERFASVQRTVGDRLTVVTGLPRADRWVEVRAGAVEHLIEVAATHGHVVVDTGFSLEGDLMSDLGSRPARNQATVAALAAAHEVLVVGAADPVGLARLARGLVELTEAVPGPAVRVVINRMRPSLGWSEKEVAGMVEGFARLAGIHFLPDDRQAVDKALVGGRTLAEIGDSPIHRAVGALVDVVAPETRLRRRRAGRAHRR